MEVQNDCNGRPLWWVEWEMYLIGSCILTCVPSWWCNLGMLRNLFFGGGMALMEEVCQWGQALRDYCLCLLLVPSFCFLWLNKKWSPSFLLPLSTSPLLPYFFFHMDSPSRTVRQTVFHKSLLVMVFYHRNRK